MIPNVWTKACNGASACVEVNVCDGEVWVRDSKLGEEWPVLRFTTAEWLVFLDAIDRDAQETGVVGLLRFDDDWWEMFRVGEPAVSLTFTDDEVDAFVRGVLADEFTPGALAAPTVDAATRGCDGPLAGEPVS